QLIVASISGDPSPVVVGLDKNKDPELKPSCSSNFGVATPAVRTSAFVSSFTHATHVRICDADLSAALDENAKGIVIAIGDPCIEGNLADTDPKTPGVQPDCAVSDVTHPGQPNESEKVIAACDASHSRTPCWTLEDDPAQCKVTPSKKKLVVDRGSGAAPADTNIRAQCVIE